MDATSILNIAVPIVFLVVGIVLIWLIIELAKTIKTTRKTIDEMQTKLAPTLDNVSALTEGLQPTVNKLDPMMDRIGLTVDAVNLELMRVDQILEDVNDVTGSISKTSNTIDSVASAPLNLVNSMTERVRGALRSGKSVQPSAESVALAEEAQQNAATGEVAGEQTAAEQSIPVVNDGPVQAAEDEGTANPGYFTYGQTNETNQQA